MQQIIVYRNPMEAAFWDMMSGGTFFPVIVAIVVFFAVFLTADRFVVERFPRRTRGTVTNINLVVSGLVGIGVAVWMFSRI